MTLRLFYPLTPRPKQSTRIGRTKTGKVIAYPDQEVVSFQTDIKVLTKQQLKQQAPDFKIWSGCPVYVRKVEFRFSTLSSFNKAQKQLIAEGNTLPKTTKPDLTDNLPKALFDALEGILYDNDSQICELHSLKVYSQEASIYLEISDTKPVVLIKQIA